MFSRFPLPRKPLASLTALLLTLALLYLLAHSLPFPLHPLRQLPPLPMFRPSSSSSSSSSWNRPPIPAYCIPSADFWSRKYTEENLLLSRAYTSSGARFRNVVHKALRGEPIKMGVLGGSVSRGRNVENGPTYHQRIFRMWNETFFPHPGNEIVDGSRAATGSKYFSMCFPAHIPEDVDIVLLELSINDRRRIDDAEAWETLVRALLELPNKPAVISTSTFALQFSQGLGVGGDLHLGVAQYYDIPVISLRNPLLPYLFSTPALEWELFGYSKGLDRRHLNALGHELLADFTTHWMREQVCKVLSEHDAPPRANVQPSWWTAPVDLSQVPRLRMSDIWLNVNSTPSTLQPSCRSTSSLPRLQPTSSDGWTFESAPGEKFYWSAEEPGARITFPIRTVEGRVGVFFLRSAGMRLGNARCWVDRDASFGELAVGYWEKEQSVADFIELGGDLPAGEHEVTCEVSTLTKDPGGGHKFKIMGLATV